MLRHLENLVLIIIVNLIADLILEEEGDKEIIIGEIIGVYIIIEDLTEDTKEVVDCIEYY